MAVKELTAPFVREARAEPGKERSIYWDAMLPSFGLMVTSAGHKSWVLQYRNGQTSRRYTINSVLRLEDARREARNILGQVARGQDPVQERRKASDASKNTLRAVCERYLAREGGKLRTTAKRQANLERCVYPTLGDRHIEDIKRSDINALLDDVEDNRGPAMADQILATLRRIFNWHAIRDDQFRTPFVRGMARRKPEERERRRFLNDDELGAVWKTAEAFPSPWGQFIRFLLLTACRRTEAAEMTWGEVVDGNWVIPPLRYKTGAEVTLPLSKAAKTILAELPRIQDCEFVFTTNGRVPISGLSVFKMRFDAACGVKDWRIHDLRRTARSLLSRAGVNTDIAERCLGHVLPGVRGVYDRHHYLDEMQAAFEALATQINAVLKRGP
jgi:integrase